MKRIDRNTVELTRTESKAFYVFDLALDEGLGIFDAIEVVKAAHPRLDPAFYAYLADPLPSPQCEAHNPNAGGRCQRLSVNGTDLCEHHQDWRP